ncbi:zf-HC2 domain-containing protein [Streptomyces sp. SBST2-5]|uniref:Zf-HC2 domain-containing protein n=1 Tax=Streptomyces composti TaxID=2720025 RepID=A0ABX1AEU8_9ACTN|nr:zf-HC2 domain-containing protein [Streptomyces composti]NJP52363.1 zf-HC2 domain-containing protein [Streptomyces composti]
MSGSRPKSPEGHLAEQHLGDRLSALVDGELGHDARERVLAHVATCARCKAEVDEQRRLKSVFAQAAPPPPSESLLARLQGLPAGGDLGGGAPLGGGLPGTGSGVFGARRGDRFEFAYAPTRRHAPALGPSPDRGFRIHEVTRPEHDRAASRGLRFAFAAAGAVSLAAIALGGVATMAPTDAEVRGPGKGSNVTPARTQGAGAAAASESQRRRGGAAPLLSQMQGTGTFGDTPTAPTVVSAPLLPGAGQGQGASPLGDAAPVSPLIRPLGTTAPPVLTGWADKSGIKTPDLLPTAGPTPSSRTVR